MRKCSLKSNWPEANATSGDVYMWRQVTGLIWKLLTHVTSGDGPHLKITNTTLQLSEKTARLFYNVLIVPVPLLFL